MEKNNRFETVLQENPSMSEGIQIIRDKQTGVQYLFARNGTAGGLTVLVDKDGKPLVNE
ncbi:MAG: DUF6440 family protein [Clostridiales bacterium]|jgi:hypothetical protein|nr:DUF6440 family protein [Clostridiales bacterium]